MSWSDSFCGYGPKEKNAAARSASVLLNVKSITMLVVLTRVLEDCNY